MAFWNKRRQPVDGTIDGLIKIRGGLRRYLNENVRVDTRPEQPRSWAPRGLGRFMAGSVSASPWEGTFSFTGRNRAEFYRWLRDKIPIINAGVWAWVRLCSTSLSRIIESSAAEKGKTIELLASLDQRILEMPYGRGSGFAKLTEAYFLELFTVGKFAGELILSEDEKSIDHFRYVDPYRIGWEHTDDGWIPVEQSADGETKQRLSPKHFFYGTIGTDLVNPLGSEPLAAIPFVAEVEQLMLEDMARSSHNAGTPRLQVKVNRPDRYNWEGDIEYSDRANRYFRDVVSEFQNLEPDDNIFTWSDVEVTVVGRSGIAHQWRLGREQVIEDVITGLHLFPWVLGRTHSTTRNWVQSQYDFLMEMVSSHQKSGTDLVDWICNLELELQGSKSRVTHAFSRHANPFRTEKARAEKIELENIDFKVMHGYISKDQGAKEMNYSKAFKPEVENESPQ